MVFRTNVASCLLIVALCIACLPSACFGAADKPKEAPDKSIASAKPDAAAGDIVARIDDEVITRAEFDKAVQVVGGGAGRAEMSISDQMQLLNQMIDTRVVYILANKAGIKATDEEIKKGIEDAKKGAADPGAYEKFLKERGITEKEFQDSVGKRIMTKKYLDEAMKDVALSEEESNQAAQDYERMKAAGRLDAADVAHILIMSKGEGDAVDAEAKKKIDAARDRIVKGEEFGKVAEEVSEDPGSAKNGGLYSKVPRGRMVAEFEKRMFETPLNEVSEPFRTQFGWHILKVTSRTQMPLDDFRSIALNRKKARTMQTRMEEAKKGMKIEILLSSGAGKSAEGDAKAKPETKAAPKDAPKPENKKESKDGKPQDQSI